MSGSLAALTQLCSLCAGGHWNVFCRADSHHVPGGGFAAALLACRNGSCSASFPNHDFWRGHEGLWGGQARYQIRYEGEWCSGFHLCIHVVDVRWLALFFFFCFFYWLKARQQSQSPLCFSSLLAEDPHGNSQIIWPRIVCYPSICFLCLCVHPAHRAQWCVPVHGRTVPQVGTQPTRRLHSGHLCPQWDGKNISTENTKRFYMRWVNSTPVLSPNRNIWLGKIWTRSERRQRLSLDT